MKFINLCPETAKMLERIYHDSQHHKVRQRAHCILLSHRGFKMEKLLEVFKISRRTLQYWFQHWEQSKLPGLYDQPGRGRKPKLTTPQKQQVREWIKAEPKNLNKVINQVQEEWGIKVSKDTIKRGAKQLGMTWRRMKRGLAGSPFDWEYEFKLEKLKELKELDKTGKIDLRFLDESGMSLTPSIPYGWQDKKERTVIPSASSKRLNILGVMNRQNELEYELYSGNLNSAKLIKFLDKFSKKITKRTVVVMDQASIHTSNAVVGKLEEWETKNLEIFWLPPYSPELNLIEILWKFIKHEWIKIEAYKNWQNLVDYVTNVLENLGKEYAINFA
ncbi:IS630 family transposase [Laspinema olomoucense]|uniref:IS630 family transposase n=1 Tax=Laspinema olomoucense TaxID=3231600 RepID=UPI0021BB798C|nr:IS630 family transposase [Laspinema sp. D3a]MCT7991961.1 IS630 family transposase [Laspinema sp. D3a]